MAEDIAAGSLIRLLEDWTPPRPGFSLYYPGRRNPSAGFAAFLRMVRERAARMAVQGYGPASTFAPHSADTPASRQGGS